MSTKREEIEALDFPALVRAWDAKVDALLQRYGWRQTGTRFWTKEIDGKSWVVSKDQALEIEKELP